MCLQGTDHIRNLFDSSARVFTLRELDPIRRPEPAPAPPPVAYVAPAAPEPIYESAELPPPAPSPSYKWVAEWETDRPTRNDREMTRRIIEDVLPMESAAYASREPTPIVTREPSVATREVEVAPIVETLQVELETILTDVPTISDDFASYMRRISVHRVGEFLELDPDHCETQLGEHGITSEMVQRRQREILMMVYVKVPRREAELLVACGVPDPARLARADEAVLLKRVETILSRPQATERFGTIERYNLVKVRSWIDSARSSSFRGRTRRDWNTTPPQAARLSSTTTRSTSSRSRSTTTSQRRRSSPKTVRIKQSNSLRFYLDTQDPVVDAPSIGPKTAEKLHAIGVHTVADLLNSGANDIASQLNEKRFSPEVVEQWQLQAELVCCIPNLRGHDAQILVSCGIEDPETLAAQDASTFLRTVMQFVESKDGQRALRNAKKPDLAEVTAWIEWSESARPLRAA